MGFDRNEGMLCPPWEGMCILRGKVAALQSGDAIAQAFLINVAVAVEGLGVARVGDERVGVRLTNSASTTIMVP